MKPEEYFPLLASSCGRKEVYMLCIHGDSMIEIGIYDGDKVVVQTCDIVVALVDDSATVKRFYKENGHYRLQLENDSVNVQEIIWAEEPAGTEERWITVKKRFIKETKLRVYGICGSIQMRDRNRQWSTERNYVPYCVQGMVHGRRKVRLSWEA